MYEQKGICYHTGYKIKFRETLLERIEKAVLRQIKDG